jgi:Rrf2 family protein
MKLGTKTRYSTRAMLDLALNYDESNGDGLLSTRLIAQHQELSAKYLEALLAPLRAAGLLRTVRGPQGGHTLARHPADINLRQIYHVFEGTEGFVECTTDPEYCQRTDGCVTQEVWAHMYGTSMQVLESTTLEDLAHRARERIQEEVS